MNDFTQLTDLALARLGGRALIASDEFFAPKESLLKPGRGVYVEDRYTDHGKWMDGWETRRRRDPGHDWCIVRLAVPGIVRGVNIDTNHFRGNHPQAASVDGCRVEGDVPPEALTGPDVVWTPLLRESELEGHAVNLFPIEGDQSCSHVRLNIHPDGGVARFRVHGEARPDWERLAAGGDSVDLAATLHGGLIVACSDRFFSAPENLLMPGSAANPGEGWETRRRRGPGHDWCIIRLGRRGLIDLIEVDTSHFKGNHPDRCSLEVSEASAGSESWTALLPPTALQAHRVHRFPVTRGDAKAATLVRFNIYPDGGVGRLRLHGRPVAGGTGS